MNFESYVKSLGLDVDALTVEAKQALQAAYLEAQTKPAAAPAPLPRPVPVADGTTDALRQIEALKAKADIEEKRQSAILALATRWSTDCPDRTKEFAEYAQLAISAGVSEKDAELEFLRRSYKNGPLAFSTSKPRVNDEVIEAALLRAAGHSATALESEFSDQTLSAADRHFRGGCGLQQAIVTAARASGMRDADYSMFKNGPSLKRLLRASFGDEGGGYSPRADGSFGPSTTSLSGIFSNAMNKSIRVYFNAVENVWRQITATRPVTDFKSVTGYALTGDLTYDIVRPGGEVKHGTLGEQSYSNHADLYAKLLGIDYQQLRNDDLSAFNQVGNRLGRGSALTINNVFWAAALAGPAGTGFFSTANGNYRSNADVSLSDLDNLDNVFLQWMARTDPDGQPMADEAKYLVVAPKYAARAARYMTSTRVSNDSGNGEDNVFAGKWTPLSSTYLSSANITGADTAGASYLLVGDPMALPFIEVVFLDGQEVPTIDTAEPDLSRLGIMIRGMHGFGVARQDPRGAYFFDGVS